MFQAKRSSDEQSVTSTDTDRSEPRRRYVSARGKENVKQPPHAVRALARPRQPVLRLLPLRLLLRRLRLPVCAPPGAGQGEGRRPPGGPPLLVHPGGRPGDQQQQQQQGRHVPQLPRRLPRRSGRRRRQARLGQARSRSGSPRSGSSGSRPGADSQRQNVRVARGSRLRGGPARHPRPRGHDGGRGAVAVAGQPVHGADAVAGGAAQGGQHARPLLLHRPFLLLLLLRPPPAPTTTPAPAPAPPLPPPSPNTRAPTAAQRGGRLP